MAKTIKLKQIYIGNILESYYKGHQKLPKDEMEFWTKYDALDNNRSILYGGDDKVIITPIEIDSKHFETLKKLAGWKNVINLFPKKLGNTISLDLIKDKTLSTKFIEIIKNNPNIQIIPYRQTDEFYDLVDFLKSKKLKFTLPETFPKGKKFIETYFHSKRGFRHLWEMVKDPKLPIHLPEGFIVENLEEAIEAAWWFMGQKKNFVIKYNRGVQGIGVIFMSQSKLPKNKEAFSKQIRKDLDGEMWHSACLVVEEKVDTDTTKLGGSPNVEMRIDENGKVINEYACEQIIAEDKKTFMGVGMNKNVDKSKHIKIAFAAAKKIGKKLAEYGYKGVFDMDLVVSKTNKLYAIEANLRRTGGTHAHEFCKALLGKNYSTKYFVNIQDIKLEGSKKLTPAQAYKLFDKELYTKQKGYGMILANPDLLACNILAVLFIGKSEESIKKQISSIRNKLK
ncbi:hypothetical protein HYV31_00525 [candidate division WWE3 bacterium]|nr:hypothetical protein [candidate division WWE3 bacterium]